MRTMIVLVCRAICIRRRTTIVAGARRGGRALGLRRERREFGAWVSVDGLKGRAGMLLG